MPQQILPTVGRVVLYVPTMGKVAPAIVSAVHNDTCVNLHVMVDDGAHPYQRVTSVCLDDSAEPRHGTWHWMPYQLGQAARTEAAEAKTP